MTVISAHAACPVLKLWPQSASYVDKSGTSRLEGGGSPLLVGNNRWLGPGGEWVLMQKDGDVIVFHAYDATSGHPFVQISTLTWNDGWPSATLDGN